MTQQMSPGVASSEIDLTTVVPSVSTTRGAFAGSAIWGPAGKITYVDSEITLVNNFGEPNTNTYVDFFSAADFLAYSNSLAFNRVVNANTFNAQANTSGASIQIENEDIYNIDYLHLNSGNTHGAFVARYAGSLGNSIQVNVFDSSNTNTFSSWTYAGYFNGAPNTSSFVSSAGGLNDEFHIIVTDAGGSISGTKGGVLEVYPYVSKSYDAIDGNGVSTYYKNVLLNQSAYVYAIDPVDYSNTSPTWGQSSTTTFTRASNASYSMVLSGGTDAAVVDADYMNAWDLFSNKDEVDVSLIISGGASVTLQQYLIDNIATPVSSLQGRAGDSVVTLSPPYAAVVNQAGKEPENIQAWLSSLGRDTSYAFVDSGWKYIYDKYNKVYRYIPLNASTAGCMVYTDASRDAWWSPAGNSRGQIKNVVKLAWNPRQSARDLLYPLGVNPVITKQGEGTILFGDKTLQSKPSAFDRINVRRLFIVLEKAIAQAARYSLFEFNDAFTQAQFVAMVSPFLRDVQGRRGIYDYRVVCDGTNNTPQVVDSNRFVGDIYIKPARSINFIQLNFVAVGTGVSFSIITGGA